MTKEDRILLGKASIWALLMFLCLVMIAYMPSYEPGFDIKIEINENK